MKLISKEYCNRILQEKKIDATEENLKKTESALKNSYGRIYHAICINIDNTLTPINEIYSDNVLEMFSKLVYYGINICFITGRSENRTKEFLLPLINALKEKNPNFTDEMFFNWIAITNNGTYQFRSKNTCQAFFTDKKVLVESSTLKEFLKHKDKLRTNVCKTLSEFLEYDYDNLFDMSKKHGSHTTLRFLLPNIRIYEEAMILAIADKIKETITHVYSEEIGTQFKGFIARGLHREDGKEFHVFEVSMSNKGKAVNELEIELGIPRNSMIRIGDQGSILGNDYEMLNCVEGFSAGVVSSKIDCCFPIIDNKGCLLKGKDAVIQLLNDVYICQPLCLHKKDKTTYMNELTIIEQKARKHTRETIKSYNQLMKPWIEGIETDSVFDVFDKASGGICLADCEWRTLDMFNNRETYRLFQTRCSSFRHPAYKYSMLNEDHMILRGPLIYYRGLSLVEDDKNAITYDYLKSWMLDSKEFIQNATHALNKDISQFDFGYLDRKLLLGICDNIRNILLLWYNILLEEEIGDKNMIYNVSGDKLINSVYDLIKDNCEYMYTFLFQKVDIARVTEYVEYLGICECIFAEVNKKIESRKVDTTFSARNAIRNWRETDNYLENVMAISIAMNRFKKRLGKKNGLVVSMYGMRYGGIELPIIAEILCRKQGWEIECITQWVISQAKMNYTDRMNESEDDVDYEMAKKIEYGEIHLIFDDNIATGKTLQLALNALVKKGINVDGVAVVRYPTTNRIEQMFDASSTPNLDLFFRGVHGLAIPSPYSRLNKVGCFGSNVDKDKYLDELGVFDLRRNAVIRNLYKNGVYVSKSEVETVCPQWGHSE